MELILLLIVIILLIQSNNNALSLLASIVILGVAAYAVIWIGALAFVVALIGN
jgi:hypothetical protein